MIAKPDILETVAREGFQATRKGRAWWMTCPFHADKSPSMKLDPERQSFFCFGCRAKGDAVDFVKRIHRLDFKEAARRLGLQPGRPPEVDPILARKRELKRAYERAWRALFERFCDVRNSLASLQCAVLKNPDKIKTDGQAAQYAELMGCLAHLEHKLDIMMTGDPESIMALIKSEGEKRGNTFF